MKKSVFLLIIFGLPYVISETQERINLSNETREEYENRMKWFYDSKFGMFVHFGLYSQLGGVWNGETYEGYGEWIQADADISSLKYADLKYTFNPTNFDAENIVTTAKKAGMKYLVITTKHHEGFCLWDSEFTDFDVASTPFKRDILAELSAACRKHNIKFGTYYSIIDWHHPSQVRNNEGNNGWTRWGENLMKTGRKAEYIIYMKNQINELITNYDTDILWFDGDWVDWWDFETGMDLYHYIRELKPDIIINNRVAKREILKKDFGTPEQSHLELSVDYYWEACYTMNSSWGYHMEDKNWKRPLEIYNKLKDINGKGGNLLLNVGPDGKGDVPGQSLSILREVGELLKNDN